MSAHPRVELVGFLLACAPYPIQERTRMKPFHIMAKPYGPICNLDCTYCYYLEKENLYPRSGRDFRMSDSVLENYIRQYIATYPLSPVQFAWQGGEPTLLGISFFQRVL